MFSLTFMYKLIKKVCYTVHYVTSQYLIFPLSKSITSFVVHLVIVKQRKIFVLLIPSHFLDRYDSLHEQICEFKFSVAIDFFPKSILSGENYIKMLRIF